MKNIIFVAFTVLIAWCRFQLPPGSPDFLTVWLVALAFYSESKFGTFQAFWIGILHNFPNTNPFIPLIAILTFKALQHQRYHLGRDHFLPRFFTVAALTTIFDVLEWVALSSGIRPAINETLQLIGTHAAFTAIIGIPLLCFAQKMEVYLGFRQTRYDF